MTRFRWHSYIGSLLVILTLAACAGHGHGGSAVNPASTGLSGGERSQSGGVESRRYLFGLWDVSLNRESGQFEAVPLRSAGFHVNVVDYMQSSANLGITMIYENYTTGEFHLDVTLTHPFPNSDLRGFDVRGMVFGNMSSKDDPDIMSSKDDPDLLWMGPNGFKLLNPDGWTRWWNPIEFSTAGLFGYTEAIFGTKGFICPATLNPYKYFANCLNATSQVVPAVNSTNRGTFATDEGPVTRRYELVFPILGSGFPDARFQYAIDASWAPPTGGGAVPPIGNYPPEANCAEPFYVKVDSSESTAYYIDNTNRGGDLVLNIEVFDWGAPYEPSGVQDEVEAIKIESPTLFSGVVQVPLTAQPGSSNLSGIFTLTMPVTPTSLADQQILVTVVSAGDTYQPPQAGPDYPAGKKLASYALAAVPIRKIEPIVIGQIVTNGEVIDLETRGYVNYLLDTIDGLQMYNVANPESPFLMNSVALPSTPIALDVENGYAFVIDSGSNLQIVDVDPVGSAGIINTVALAGTPVCIDVDSGYAYVGFAEDAVFIYDVDPPETAFVAGSVLLNGAGPIKDVAVRNGYAYVAADDLEIFDVDPPGSAGFVNSVATVWQVVTVDVSDTGYAFIGDSFNQFQVIDVEPVGSATIVDTLMLGGQINDLVSVDDFSYVTMSGIGMGVVAFNSGSNQASEVADLSTAKSAGAISVQGNKAYIDGEVIIVELWEEQQQKIGWARTWGAATGEYCSGYTVAVDGSGNIYVAGSFLGTVDFDPGSSVENRTSNGSYDAFLSKFDSSGNLLWARTFGGADADQGSCVATDITGNVYVVGYYGSVTDFDPGAGTDNQTSNGGMDVFLSKFDPSGIFLWARTWGGTDVDRGTSVASDGSGNVYVTGFYDLTVDFDPGGGVDNRTSNGYQDVFLSNFDSSGNLLWVKTWGGIAGDVAASVAADNAGYIFVGGGFQSTVDFDPGGGVDNHTSIGYQDVFISKLDSSGNYQWAQTWGASLEYTECFGVVANSSDVHVIGIFSGTADFDPGGGSDNHTAVGIQDIFLSQFNSFGVFQWARTWGFDGPSPSPYFSPRGGIALDGSGNVYSTGCFEGTVDFDPGAGVDGHTSNGSADIFLSKFDSSGNFTWAKTWGGWYGDVGNGVAVDGLENVYVTGKFEATVDFDPGSDVDEHSTNGGIDAFVSKFLPDGNW